MQTNREGFLQALESVDAGLASKDIVEQSSCFVFHKGKVMTFNGEVACMTKSPLGKFAGAVPAKELKELLTNIPDEDIDVSTTDTRLRIKAKGGRGSMAVEAEIALPVDQIENPSGWADLDPAFCDAVAMVVTCAAKDDNNYKLTCVNITPDHVEACDNFQLSRYPLTTGFKSPCMIKATSIKHVAALGMTQVSETETWVHFKNPAGLRLSCRRWEDEYESLDGILASADGEPATLPGGLDSTVKRNQVFSSDGTDNLVKVRIKDGRMVIRGESVVGYWEEAKKIKYKGPAIAFAIDPTLLVEISGRAHECKISADSLRVDSGGFTYITCLEKPE